MPLKPSLFRLFYFRAQPGLAPSSLAHRLHEKSMGPLFSALPVLARAKIRARCHSRKKIKSGPALPGRLKMGPPQYGLSTVYLKYYFTSWRRLVPEECGETPKTETHQKNFNIIYTHAKCRYLYI